MAVVGWLRGRSGPGAGAAPVPLGAPSPGSRHIEVCYGTTHHLVAVSMPLLTSALGVLEAGPTSYPSWGALGFQLEVQRV